MWLGLCLPILTLLQLSNAHNVCPVSEALSIGGVCNANDGDKKCENYCRERFGRELVDDGFKCQAGQGRAEGLRQCICSLNCVTAIWHGEPFYTTFDGAAFQFDGLCEHLGVALEPDLQQPDVPQFEVFLTNARLHPHSPDNFVSIPRTLKLWVHPWHIEITVDMTDDYTFKIEVNGNYSKSLPYRYSVLNAFVENYVEVTQVGAQNIRVETSFGVSFDIESFTNGRVIVVHLARHPALLGKTTGIFGRWDGDNSNDAVDRYGMTHNPDDKKDAQLLGESWCVETRRKRSAENIKGIILAYEEKIGECMRNNQQRVSQLCEPLNTAPFAKCLGPKGVKTVEEECFSDVCLASQFGQKAEEEAASAVIAAFASRCDIE